MDGEQLRLPDQTWRCDVCVNGVETDPETLLERRCRVCGGQGVLPYDPAGAPFETMERIA